MGRAESAIAHERTVPVDGATIKSLREDSGWTQEKFAEESGLTTDSVNNYENKPGHTVLPVKLKGVAKAFGCWWEDLIAQHVDGAAIKSLREDNGWTQEDLSQKTKIDIARVRLIEDDPHHGVCSLTLKRIADAYGCPWQGLVRQNHSQPDSSASLMEEATPSRQDEPTSSAPSTEEAQLVEAGHHKKAEQPKEEARSSSQDAPAEPEAKTTKGAQFTETAPSDDKDGAPDQTGIIVDGPPTQPPGRLVLYAVAAIIVAACAWLGFRRVTNPPVTITVPLNTWKVSGATGWSRTDGGGRVEMRGKLRGHDAFVETYCDLRNVSLLPLKPNSDGSYNLNGSEIVADVQSERSFSGIEASPNGAQIYTKRTGDYQAHLSRWYDATELDKGLEVRLQVVPDANPVARIGVKFTIGSNALPGQDAYEGSFVIRSVKITFPKGIPPS